MHDLKNASGPNNLKFRKVLFHGISSVFFMTMLTACGGGKSEPVQKPVAEIVPPATTTPANSTQICVFSNDEEATRCKTGQVAFYAPSSWGNEQLPIAFAAKYCDFNFQITQTRGAVACIFLKGRAVVQSAPTQNPADEQKTP